MKYIFAAILSLFLTVQSYADDGMQYVRKFIVMSDIYQIECNIYYNKHDHRIAYYSALRRSINLNLASNFWDNPQLMQKDMYTTHFASTDHIDHALIHEFAHLIFNEEVGDFEFIKSGLPVPTKLVPRIKKEVSEYACTNISEFVAEVYTGMFFGKEYSKEIMEYYYTLWDK